MRRVAERVTGRGVLEADGRDDVAREDAFLVFAVVGVHLEDATDALLLVLRRVEHGATRAELAGVDAEVGELAHVGVAHDLERERRERLVVAGRTGHGLAGLHVDALDRGMSTGHGR